MSELTADRFGEFFEELWGSDRKAFSWQRALAARVIANKDKPWPDAIALPTASGKTACIDIAIFALAAQAGRIESGEPVTAPRRIFFAVDRRIIVDEAHTRALELAKKLCDAKEGILKSVADRLRLLAHGQREGADGADPLAVFELRGGMYRSEAWARSPLQPTIVASTVDQLGSRLLFRAYGRGHGMWPVYAGLVANDSLVLLDEAHCARPFLETLQAVARYRTWGKVPMPVRFYPVVMSATPPPGLSDIFHDESGEPHDPMHPLGKRQLASKRTTLSIVEVAKGKKATEELATALSDAAEHLATDTLKAVVVFANRVATAREAYRRLAKKHGGRAVLLTGRMRPIDKDDTVQEQLKPLASGCSGKRSLNQSVFVVATQTLEVGADLDFDALVSECASLDALRQRFGRLNRMGRPIDSRAAILIRADQAENSEDDPVYGAAIANTWAWLNDLPQRDSRDHIDLGVDAINGAVKKYLHKGGRLDDLNAPAASAPVMLPSHIDCWVQTSPEPEPTPDVAPFLRGPERGTADLQVCWRSDIDLATPDKAAASIDVLTLCPPAATECLSVPIATFKRWLSGEEAEDETSDVEIGQDSASEVRSAGHTETRIVLLWRGRDEVKATADAREIRPGDTIVIPSGIGGWQSLGDLPCQSAILPTLDWGDRANWQVRARAQLRLHASVIKEWPDFPSKLRMLDFVGEARERYDDDPDALANDLREILRSVDSEEDTPKWLCEVASTLAADRRLQRGIRVHPLGGLIVHGNHRRFANESAGDRFSDEHDASASGTVRVPLLEHLEGVASYARRFAVGCGVPAPLARAIECAGALHDLGKADPRFQALLLNGNPWMGDVLLAKSDDIPQGQAAFERARKSAGYPRGARHEMLSVRLIEQDPRLLPEDEIFSDIILYLVASHHGHCRPFAPIAFDSKPVGVQVEFRGRLLAHPSDSGLEQLNSGNAERFWRLVRHFGWWGIAWLEAILRLADHRRSEAEAARREGDSSVWGHA